MTVYKIRNKEDGKFCQGGEYCYFGKSGKIWTEQSLKRHLGWALHPPDVVNGITVWEDPHTNCEVVAFEMTEAWVSDLNEWFGKARRDEENREAKKNRRIEAEQIRVFGETF